MNHPYTYIGCFIPFEELFEKIKILKGKRLFRIIQNPHITFVYEPDQVDESLFGQNIKVKIIAYGNDGRNEGVKVELFSDNQEIKKMAARIETPHITLSVSENGKSVNTKYIDFKPIDPIKIFGKFGGYTENGLVVTDTDVIVF